MGLLSKLISAPFRIVNAPIRAAEAFMGCEREDDRLLSKPLDAIADEVEKIDGDDD